jgi:hypothetical protein
MRRGWGGTRALYDTCLGQIENRKSPVCKQVPYILIQNIRLNQPTQSSRSPQLLVELISYVKFMAMIKISEARLVNTTEAHNRFVLKWHVVQNKAPMCVSAPQLEDHPQYLHWETIQFETARSAQIRRAFRCCDATNRLRCWRMSDVTTGWGQMVGVFVC